MGNIHNLFKDMNERELREFTEKLFQTNLDLKKELERSDEKIRSLESMLIQATPSTLASPNEPKEKLIAEMELNKLYEISKSQVLTAEESKKVDTYTKILQLFRDKQIAEKKPEEELPTAQLLQLVHESTE